MYFLQFSFFSCSNDKLLQKLTPFQPQILAYGRLPIVEIAQPTLQELIRSHLPLSLDSRDEDPQKEEKILAKENQELDFRLVTGFLTDDLKRVELSLELNPPSNSLFQEGESVIDESSLVSSNLEQVLFLLIMLSTHLD